MASFQIRYWNGESDVVTAPDVESACEAIYGPKTPTGFTADGIWWAVIDGIGHVGNRHGDDVARVAYLTVASI